MPEVGGKPPPGLGSIRERSRHCAIKAHCGTGCNGQPCANREGASPACVATIRGATWTGRTSEGSERYHVGHRSRQLRYRHGVTGLSPTPPEELVRALLADGIWDTRVIEAFRQVRRDGFVPRPERRHAYEDRPIPIAHRQVATQPSLIARMLQGLQLKGDERVLEVGTGLGFQTALLALLAREVFSVERFADLAEQARANLEQAGIAGVTIVVGDGTLGLPEHAPFDAIVVAAAAPRVPQPLADQLAPGGRIVQPIGPGGSEVVIAFRKGPLGLVEEARLTGAFFVRLVGAHGLREAERG